MGARALKTSLELTPDEIEADLKDQATADSLEDLVEQIEDLFLDAGVQLPRRQVLEILANTFGDVEGLMSAITGELEYIDDQAMFEYERHIESLDLSDEHKDKLLEMMSGLNYVEAVDTAKEMHASTVPSYQRIAAELMKLSTERLREICETMEQPTLAIVADQSFYGHMCSMNENKHYINANGATQTDVLVHGGAESPYENLSQHPGLIRVSVVDGIPEPKGLTGVSNKFGERRERIGGELESHGMRHIDAREMATLLQRSLRVAKIAKKPKLIVSTDSVTILDPATLQQSTRIAYAVFCLSCRQPEFGAEASTTTADNALARAAFTLFEMKSLDPNLPLIE